MTGSQCSIDGCSNLLRCRGWCDMHYSRWRKNGSPHVRETLTPRRLPAMDRWWLRVHKEDSGCWVWTGDRHSNGYGRFGEPLTRRQLLAHRFGYQQLVGEVPEGFELDHLCRNKRCVNPEHLEPVTHKENVQRWQATIVKSTHCRNGHEYTHDNCDWHGTPPVRRCRTCRRVNERKRWGGKPAGVVP